eukprot:GHVN01005275.1.p1 GENE.GHVN01005275.1~~GHVN01005275.1.p1  ORF type:complete len:159 (-),score=20.39 GHVN01005275.1:606-1082(-)
MVEPGHSSNASPVPPLTIQVDAVCGRARATTISLPHGKVPTPCFMPVGTHGSIKGLTSQQVEDLNVPIILGNTYHLNHHPGSAVLKTADGLHGFMGWSRNLLTDSGGFQMVSLTSLAEITEEGVRFAHPVEGTEMMLTPEKSIETQVSGAVGLIDVSL